MAPSRLLAFCTLALLTSLCVFCTITPAFSAESKPIPLGERWFGILINQELVGFYRQTTQISPTGGYRIEGSGSIRMNIMGFSKESSSHEIYLTSPSLALHHFEVEQTINGSRSRVTGVLTTDGLQLVRDDGNAITRRLLKVHGDIVPGPFLNLIPLHQGIRPGRHYQAQTFDPEDINLKLVTITVIGPETSPNGQQAIRLRNNLYPLVDNDIWVSPAGDTIYESVRDGLIITRAETAEQLAGLVSGIALAKKDLIYDFSMVRLAQPLRHTGPSLGGLQVQVEGYTPQTPLLDDGWQQTERSGSTLIVRTGNLRKAGRPSTILPEHLASVDGIESAAPEIKHQADQLIAGAGDDYEKARRIAAWVSTWLADSIDDAGSALTALNKRFGNCQTHAKLYTALARSSGLPTRFVSGLVSQDGKSFLYHSWAESRINGRWIAVDPTFNQLPADPTHLAFFEGHRLTDLIPLVSIIGKLKLTILEET